MSWGGSQQSVDVVFCPFFLARILAPQVSNLWLSSLMGWSEVLLGFLPLSKAICLALFLDPQPLASCSELANAWRKQNKAKQKRILQHVHLPLELFPPSAPFTFMLWLPDLFFCSPFLYVFNRGLSLSRYSKMPIMNLCIPGVTTSKSQTIQHLQEAIYGNNNSRRFIIHSHGKMEKK